MLKVALLFDSTISNQSQKFITEGKNRKCFLKAYTKYGPINITNPDEDHILKELRDFDVVYALGGTDISTFALMGDYLSKKGVHFVNSAYYKQPLFRYKTYQCLKVAASGLNVPKTLTVKNFTENTQKELINQLKLPLIVKHNQGTRGETVQLIKNKYQLQDSLQGISRLEEYIFQEFIPNQGDYRVMVVGGKARAGMNRIPQEGNFMANISQGGHGIKIKEDNVQREVFDYAEKVAESLDVEIGGFDIMRLENSNEFYFLEVNRCPSWLGIEVALKIKVSPMIYDYFESII